jgi:predicted MFS family arabinose efflux permease
MKAPMEKDIQVISETSRNKKLGRKDDLSTYAWFVLSLPWALLALTSTLNFALGIILLPMQQDLLFDTRQAGYLSSLSWFVTIVLMIPITVIMNRYGTRVIMSITFLLIATMVVLQSLATSYMMMLITRMVGLGLAVGITPAVSFLKRNWVPITKITTINGVESLMNPIGQIFATFLIPLFLIQFNNWRYIFRIIGVIIFFLGVIWLFFAREKPIQVDKPINNESNKKSIFRVFRNEVIWLLIFGMSGTSLVWTAFFTFWPSFASENLKITINFVGLILTAFPIGSIVASLIVPMISQKIGVEKPFIWVWGFLLPLFYFGMLTVKSPIILAVNTFLTGFAAFAFVPLCASIPFKIKGITSGEVAVSSGAMIMFIGFGGGIGPIIASQISHFTGSMFIGLAMCALFPLTLGICGLFLPERGRHALEKENNLN